MKNKHLVLLFLLTLFVGLAIRRAPWRNATFFQANLLRIDTAAVQQVQINLPDKPILFLLRGDAGWSVEQGDRSVSLPMDASREMLAALADLRSIRIAKTTRPDTLGFNVATAIRITLIHDKDQSETLIIGWETIENTQAATFIQLPGHEGIYLVNHHLRHIFSKALADFRNQTITRFVLSDVKKFSVFRRGLDSVIFQKTEALGRWESLSSGRSCPDDSVQTWLAKLAGLRGLVFSNLFDESHASETLFAQISLYSGEETEPLTLQIYHLSPPNLPEDLPDQKPDKRQFAPFVLHSSQNPANYFVLSDTLLLRQICQPF